MADGNILLVVETAPAQSPCDSFGHKIVPLFDKAADISLGMDFASRHKSNIAD